MRSRSAAYPIFALVGILATSPVATVAQIPTQAEALRLLQEDPQAVRDRLLASGLSENEIRARLSAAGLAPDLLDAYLSDAPMTQPPGVDANTLEALTTLGILVDSADGLELVSVTTGMQPGLEADSVVGTPVFGVAQFSRATSRFQPLLSGPVPDDYRVGPGDQMVLILTGDVELAREMTVNREGFVVVEDVGRISVANLTMAQVRALMRSRLASSYSGIERGTVTMDVTISELKTIQVYVSGEVVQPGAYQLASVATILNSLYAAGGPTELGGLREISIQRRSGERLTLDMYPYLLRGDASEDVTLEQGDFVFVPLKGRRVQLVGSVVRPAHFELAGTEGLADVLRSGGGFAPSADRRRITIHRVARPGEAGPGRTDRLAIDLELRPSDDPSAPNHVGGVVIPPVGLQDGDSIVVDEVAPLADSYYVTIAGMVAAPDTFPWHEGITLRELVLLARGPTVGADLRAAEVSRLPDDRALGELADRLRVPLDSSYLRLRQPDGGYAGPPGVPFLPPGSAPEFVLEPFDQVTIYQQPDFEMPGTVTITGEVSVPGRYTLLTKSERVTDLVARAAGVLPQTAYPEGARLYRAQDQLGRLDLDLPAAAERPGGPNDLILQPGDSLHIPEYSPTVVVRGAVNSPVTVLYREGEDFEYYLSNAGGYRFDADKGRVAVRFANGLAQTRSKFLFWSRYPTPGPGSTITVPTKDDADRLDTRGLISDIVAILGSVTTVVIVLTR